MLLCIHSDIPSQRIIIIEYAKIRFKNPPKGDIRDVQEDLSPNSKWYKQFRNKSAPRTENVIMEEFSKDDEFALKPLELRNSRRRFILEKTD